MSDTKDDGGPFHPSAFDSRDCPSVGSSYRAWAAGIAMAGLLSCGAIADESPDNIAKWAVAYADSLIAELKK